MIGDESIQQTEWVQMRAPAKLNLTLEVLGRRADGYHEICTVLQTVDLADTLTFSPAEELSLSGDDTGIPDADNLALKAAQLLRNEAGVKSGACIHLQKRIAMAAGLGGGSSDAAATLLGLNRLWGLGASREDLAGLGAQLGSDVPFFIHGGTALAEGRGERITRLRSPIVQWFVIVPDEGPPDKTAGMYAKVTPGHYSQGESSKRLAAFLATDARSESASLAPDPAWYNNIFDEIGKEVFPMLGERGRVLEEIGAENVHLAGSGPSIFAPVASETDGASLVTALADRGIDSVLVNSLSDDGEDNS